MDILDVELQKSEEEERRAPAPRRVPLAWVAASLAAAALGGAAYYWNSRPAPAAATEVVVTQRPAGQAADAGPARPAIDLPPLDQSDALVRTLVAGLSSHPRVAAWMATPNLIRNFTVAVENIAAGTAPARHLKVLQPVGPFRVVTRGGVVHADARSYARYDTLAAAVGSIDAAGAAQVHATLRVRFDDAYRELGHEGPFDGALERAIVTLLRTPAIEPGVALVSRGALYGYADPALQALNGAQRQLLRMGPRNAAIVQEKLREIALAIGIPPRRLPSP